MDILKKCPFCGGEAVVDEMAESFIEAGFELERHYRCSSRNCAAGQMCFTAKEWNFRVESNFINYLWFTLAVFLFAHDIEGHDYGMAVGWLLLIYWAAIDVARNVAKREAVRG